jgi:hypothetical protein
MKSLAFPFLLMLAALASGPVAAQQRGVVPHPALHGVNPSLSLSAPATTPLEQQIQENNAGQLGAAQRELLQQNPSGLTRQELAVGHALNGYMGPR